MTQILQSTQRNPHSIGRFARFACAAALAVAITSCGDTAESSSPSRPDGVATLQDVDVELNTVEFDPEAGIAQYEECLAANDVDPNALQSDDPTEAEALFNDPVAAAALNDCARHLEQALGDFEIDPDEEAALIDQSADYAACARNVLDVDIPDDVLLLDLSDERLRDLTEIAPSPEQERQLAECFDETVNATGSG